jgi:hypothetical protein
MDSISSIQKLAASKFIEARCLFENDHFDWAYYTAGYTVELLFKAKVCKTLGIEDFFDEKSELMKKIRFPQTFKSHDFEQLLVLSGVYEELYVRSGADADFKAAWSSVCGWSEESRYSTGKSSQEARNFLISINEISEWILKYL